MAVKMVMLPEPESGTKRPKLTTPSAWQKMQKTSAEIEKSEVSC